ncbi:DUF6069 family protein [Deinococcus planocerae]|uniref:DUF6069 family protein n=1 Tax=Deinococcus planocerae TaxID=1737569 RepID=UPI000C7F1419|nr:DUF6069 family protein [Deinococcus planocerae]
MTLDLSRHARSSLIRNSALAALAASVLALAVFLGATAAGVPLSVPGPGGALLEISAVMIVVASVAGTLGATLVLAALNALARHPRRSFEVTAFAVLALSLVPVLAGGLPAVTALSLGAMHLVAAAAIVALLRPAARTVR